VQPYLSGSDDGYHRMQLLLKPIMWYAHTELWRMARLTDVM
jgi:hypothetical protein